MENNMESIVTIRISETDKLMLKKLALKERISMSSYLRQSISKNLNNE
jgi:hypothetical protein